MPTRAQTVAVAALLLGGAAVAFATTAVGQDFENQATLQEAGTAFAVNWQDEAGKLRLQLAPADGATAPSASVSLFSPDNAHLGTFELDEAWPQLDRVIQVKGTYTLVVHEATEGEVEVLSQEDRDVTVDPVELETSTVRLIDGEHHDLAYQVSLDRTEPVAHMGISFQGAAKDLSVEATTEDDETVLEGSVPVLRSEEGTALSTALSPAAFEQGSLLVRVQSTVFNGTLTLDLYTFPDTYRSLFTATAGQDEAPEENDTEEDETSDEDEEGNASQEAAWEPPIQGITVAELDSGTPTAFTVPTGVDTVIVYGEERCGKAILFDGEDQLAEVAHLDEDEDAKSWNEDERQVYVELALDGDGEHVVLLTGYEDAFLFVPGLTEADDDAVEVRELEIASEEVEVGEDGFLLFGSDDEEESATSAEVEIDSALIGFHWGSQGIAVDQEVRLLDPDGETLYESRGMSTFGFDLHYDGERAEVLAGGPGTYTVELDSNGPTSSSIEASLLYYVR